MNRYSSGGFCTWKKTNFELITGSLNGELFLIRGNHDRLSKTYCEAHGVALLNETLYVDYDDRIKIVFSHRPIVPLLDGLINLHGHIHNSPPPPEGSNLGPHHINMSVEVREYRPWRLQDIIKQST